MIKKNSNLISELFGISFIGFLFYINGWAYISYPYHANSLRTELMQLKNEKKNIEKIIDIIKKDDSPTSLVTYSTINAYEDNLISLEYKISETQKDLNKALAKSLKHSWYCLLE